MKKEMEDRLAAADKGAAPPGRPSAAMNDRGMMA
jgi:hypothetical protein